MYQLVDPAWFAINKGQRIAALSTNKGSQTFRSLNLWFLANKLEPSHSEIRFVYTARHAWFAMQHCLFFSVFQWVVEVTLCSSISVVRWRDQIGDRDAHGAVVFVVANHAFYLIYMSINSQKSWMLAAPNYPLCVLLCVFSWSSAIFCLQRWALVSWRQQYQSSRFERKEPIV